MIPLSLDEIADSASAGSSRPGAERVTGVQVDSRRIAAGDLFVAVNDAGAAFVEDALDRGAAAALVPDDGFAALAALGGAVRDRSSARVVGITGSAGKTSTKDILAAICGPDAARSPPRRASTTRSACRSRSAASSPTPRSASSSWRCAGSARSRSSARSRGRTSA